MGFRLMGMGTSFDETGFHFRGMGSQNDFLGSRFHKISSRNVFLSPRSHETETKKPKTGTNNRKTGLRSAVFAANPTNRMPGSTLLVPGPLDWYKDPRNLSRKAAIRIHRTGFLRG